MESSITVATLTEELQKLPGIGKKTAERLVYALLKSENRQATTLGNALRDLDEKVILCGECGGITETDPCSICVSGERDRSIICVVEQPLDIAIFERMGKFKGLYHVLMGTISPLDGMGPESLKIDKLMQRIEKNKVKEVIVATNPTMDGEATALYLSNVLKKLAVEVTRIARGIPVGGDIEYVDEITLLKSLEGRQKI
ncbi:MAG: recombination mediator RecR [Nitrospinota bacterium]|nr:recombination mediator RecR [Nitrospinota bacterium]